MIDRLFHATGLSMDAVVRSTASATGLGHLSRLGIETAALTKQREI
jgi:hypothetical protein